MKTIAALLALSLLLAACGGGSGSNSSEPINIPPVPNACSRSSAGSVVENPPALFSKNGVVHADFSYQTTTDSDGRHLFCFMTPDGLENPTLHARPGDHIKIKITNNTPKTAVVMKINSPNCGASSLTGSSVNLHFHGTSASPRCHSDEVIHTLVNSGQTFNYDVLIPSDQPPGLYWIHPHAHMLTEGALLGGASGAIVVDGIEELQPAVAGLSEQVFVIRDQSVAGKPAPGPQVPFQDLTINNVPISYPQEVPAVIEMGSGEQQFWRVSNAAADSILDLQVQFDGTAQNLQIVALDGVPTGSQDGTQQGKIVNSTDVMIPPGGRAEFIVNAPAAGVTKASLVTLGINTGPDGDNDPLRTIATIQTVDASPGSTAQSERVVPTPSRGAWKQRFANLAQETPSTTRKLFFSEDNPNSKFFVTVDGATPVLFDPNNPPAIVTTQGSTEDWTIENRAKEVHPFHLHQIHFMILSQNNFEVNGSAQMPYLDTQMLDTVLIPFWDGDPNHPFPSVTVRTDFRGSDVGDFVYHCHIAEHEDKGMMAVIRVEPNAMAAALEKFRLRLASVGWFGASESTPPEWCVRGRAADGPLRRRFSARDATELRRPSL